MKTMSSIVTASTQWCWLLQSSVVVHEFFLGGFHQGNYFLHGKYGLIIRWFHPLPPLLSWLHLPSFSLQHLLPFNEVYLPALNLRLLNPYFAFFAPSPPSQLPSSQHLLPWPGDSWPAPHGLFSLSELSISKEMHCNIHSSFIVVPGLLPFAIGF